MTWLARLGPHFQGVLRAEDLSPASTRDRRRFFKEERTKLDGACRRCGDWQPGCALIPAYPNGTALVPDMPIPCHCNWVMVEAR